MTQLILTPHIRLWAVPIILNKQFYRQEGVSTDSKHLIMEAGAVGTPARNDSRVTNDFTTPRDGVGGDEYP